MHHVTRLESWRLGSPRLIIMKAVGSLNAAKDQLEVDTWPAGRPSHEQAAAVIRDNETCFDGILGPDSFLTANNSSISSLLLLSGHASWRGLLSSRVAHQGFARLHDTVAQATSLGQTTRARRVRLRRHSPRAQSPSGGSSSCGSQQAVAALFALFAPPPPRKPAAEGSACLAARRPGAKRGFEARTEASCAAVG